MVCCQGSRTDIAIKLINAGANVNVITKVCLMTVLI